MSKQENVNYNRIAEAIDYIRQISKQQPNLDKVAEKVNVSPFIFKDCLQIVQVQAQRNFGNT